MSILMDLDLEGLEDTLNPDGEMELEFAGTVIGGPRGPRGYPGTDGEDGENGISPTFQIGTVTASPSGSVPQVEVAGDFPEYTLNFTLPRGNKGDDGDVGPQGSPGTGTATIYRSPDTPTDDQGNDGDFWFVLK